MVKTIVCDGNYRIYEIIHFIPKWKLEGANISKETIIDSEIKLMIEEMESDYPGFKVNYAYPQRKTMVSNEAYEEAINNYKHDDSNGDYLEVTLRIVHC